MWDPVCAQSQSLRHVLEGTHTHTPHSVNIFRNSSVLLNNQLLITSPRNDNKHTSASTASNTQTLHHLLQLGEVIESACRDRCQLVENKIKDPVGTYTYDPLVFVSKILSGLHSLITLFWLSYHFVLTLLSPCFDSLVTLFWHTRYDLDRHVWKQVQIYTKLCVSWIFCCAAPWYTSRNSYMTTISAIQFWALWRLHKTHWLTSIWAGFQRRPPRYSWSCWVAIESNCEHAKRSHSLERHSKDKH